MKFTETEYKTLIKIWDNNITFNGVINGVLDFVADEHGITSNEFKEQAIALAMPETREWAHERFVEKEKQFVFVSKAKDVYGNRTTLFIDRENMVQTVVVDDADKALETEDKAHYLTESQVREWGFDPAGFNKKEVK